jgi:hypothetical protein
VYVPIIGSIACFRDLLTMTSSNIKSAWKRNKGNKKITELQTILQRESQNS